MTAICVFEHYKKLYITILAFCLNYNAIQQPLPDVGLRQFAKLVSFRSKLINIGIIDENIKLVLTLNVFIGNIYNC